MSGNESLAAPLGSEALLEGLWRAAAENRLPHAMLFLGPRGVGKFTAAHHFAMGLSCEAGGVDQPGPPCGRCPACRRFAAGSADLFVVDPVAEGQETLKISRIVHRDDSDGDEGSAEEFLSLRAAGGGWRVVLLRDVERAPPVTQNALLKMLEEPGKRVLWILETSRPDALLRTVRSRCIEVRFKALSAEEAGSVLEGLGVPEGERTRLARWSRGSPGQALALRKARAPEVRALLVATLTGEASALETAAAVFEVEHELKGKPAPVARAVARAALDLAVDVLGDGVRAGAGVDPATLAHGDLFEPGGVLSGGAPEGLLRRALQSALSAREDVDLNLNPGSALDRAFLTAEDLGRPAGRSEVRPKR